MSRLTIFPSSLGGLPRYWQRSRAARARLRATPATLRYGPRRRQYVHLLEPTGVRPEDDLPWAFYFHGGAWTFGTPEAFAAAAQPWLEAGFRVALPSYRRPPTVGLAGIVADCRGALAAVADYARRTGRPQSASPPQIGGISAGGHLAALLALHPAWWSAAGWPLPPRRILLCAAPLDLLHLRPRRLFGRWAQLSPARIVGSGPELPPADWLLLHGTADTLVAPRHSTEFAALLRAAGHRAELLELAGGNHLAAGEWTLDPHHPTRQSVEAFIRASASSAGA